MGAVAAPADRGRPVLAQVAILPEEPGVYLMRDRAGQVIYVGKATDLRRRVRSYFVAAHDDRAFMPFLEREVATVEAIVVRNEKEALLLENELIKRHQPRFNIRLREGGQFVYLRLDDREQYPSLQVVRGVKDDGARYFGPYPAARALRETLRVVNRHFQLRTCTDHDPRSHARPCLLCQISRFPEPSVYDIAPGDYRSRVQDAVRFLEGRQPALVRSLRRQMEGAARALRFEEAARLRDQLTAVERTLQPQLVTTAAKTTAKEQDAAGFSRDGDRLAVYLLYIRHGRIIGGQLFRLAPAGLPTRDAVASFVALYYAQEHLVPDELLLPLEIEGADALAAVLSDRKGAPVRVVVPTRGHRRELVTLSNRNAEQALRVKETTTAVDRLRSLQQLLHLTRTPRRIDCFDVSHLGGEAIVASKVTMVDGELDKDLYRRFRIKTVEAADDYAAMREVVLRSLRREVGEGLPDLIVVDGGRAQLAAAQQAAAEAGLHDLDLVALAKERDVGEPGPLGRRRRVPERVFVPGREAPVMLSSDLPELLLLVRLRDEAHRFAITYQRLLRHRRRLRSELDGIPGVGEERRRALLRRFGSVARIAGASPEELGAVEGIGPTIAARVYAFFHGVSVAADGDAP
jgi:excinuclease ABC subunit C